MGEVYVLDYFFMSAKAKSNNAKAVEDARKARDVKHATFFRTGMILMKKTRLGLFSRFVWGSKDPSASKYTTLCWIKPKYLVSSQEDISGSFNPASESIVVAAAPPPAQKQKSGKAAPPPLSSQPESVKMASPEVKNSSLETADISETALAHIERTALCSVLTGASIGSVLPAKNLQSLCFVIRTKEGEKYKFEAPSLDVRTQWINALRWLQEGCSEVSTPSSVVHVTHVNQDMDWSSSISSETLEQEFEFGRMLGYGAFGQVYKATHKASGHILAIKTVLVDPTFMSTEEIRAEVDTLKLSKHECIVNYFGCWGPDSGNRLWMLMEFCAGGSVVDTFVKHKLQLSERQIAHACVCTLRALAHLQQKKIIHRDVKGRNVLLGAEGEIKLTDFGVAKRVIPLDPSKPRTADEAIGTPHWMAPELLEKAKISSANLWKADIWSLGITAIELAEGDPPLQALGGEELVEKILKNPPPTLTKPEEWSPVFRDFIKCCLIVDPDFRPDAALLLRHPFFAELQDGSVSSKEIMASLVYPALYSNYKKQKFSLRGNNKMPPPPPVPVVDARHPSVANTNIEEPYDKSRDKERKVLKRLMKQQVKRDTSVKETWQKSNKNSNSKAVESCLQNFSSLLSTALVDEQRRKERILAERALTSFEAIVSTQKPANQNVYQITTKIYSLTDVDDIKAYTVNRKFSDFEKLKAQLEQHLKYNSVPLLGSSGGGAAAEENRRKQLQYFLDFIAKHKQLALFMNVNTFLQGSDQEWKDCQSMTKQQKQDQEKLDSLASKGQNLSEKQLKEITLSLPSSPITNTMQYCTKVETLTMKFATVCGLLFRYAQSASKSWLVFAECRKLLQPAQAQSPSVLTPLSPSIANKSTSHQRTTSLPSSSSHFPPPPPSPSASSPKEGKDEEKRTLKESKRSIFSSKPIALLTPKSRLERSVSASVPNGSHPAATASRVRTKTASTNASQLLPLENDFNGLTAAQKALSPMCALLSELPSIAVLHQYASERARKTICDRLEQHQTLAKCMQEMCKRAEPTVFAYYATQAQLSKPKSKTALGFGTSAISDADQKFIETSWIEMQIQVVQELKDFKQSRRSETLAAMVTFVKDELTHEKKMTAVFEHLLRDLEKEV